MPRKFAPLSGFQRPLFDYCAGCARLSLGRETKIMGILNVTPDSFSDGGLFQKPKAALRRALLMQKAGAHLVDVGAESSRPGAKPVSAKEEIRRLRPVLKLLSKHVEIPISVDTYKVEVAHAALDEGAVIINDIYALGFGSRMAKLIARYKAGVVLMHMRGNPRTMQKNPFYRDVTRRIALFLKKAAETALEAGISEASIAVDPGFGFGKTIEQNFEILRRLDSFAALGYPVLVGLSRKSFIGHFLSKPVEDRLTGSLAAAAVAIAKGAHILRVHDVPEHKNLAMLADKTLWN
jgi:dihydropteroate synthase